MQGRLDFYDGRIEGLIDLRKPLAVLATRMPWSEIETVLAPKLAHRDRPGQVVAEDGLFGPVEKIQGAGVSPAGRPRLPIRLMAGLLYLKHLHNLSDENLVERWADSPTWQFFCGQSHYEDRLPCDATQVLRFRQLIGEEGAEYLLKATIDAAVQMNAVKVEQLERVIVDTTVQEKAVAHPTDCRLYEVARYQVVKLAKECGIVLNQTHAKEGRQLRIKGAGYAHAKQTKRLGKVLKRQRTILGRVVRDVERRLEAMTVAGGTISERALSKLKVILERAKRLQKQKKDDKNKLYAMHAPEVECIAKGKARKPYEFGVKMATAVAHEVSLIIGARTFTGNPFDGHILSAALEQSTNLMQDHSVKIKEVIADLGYRGLSVDADNPGVTIIHRGRYKSLTEEQRKWLKRRPAIEPVIGHMKADHRLNRCWLKGGIGDAIHAINCAAGFNISWLLRAIKRLGLKAAFLRLFSMALGTLLSTIQVNNREQLPVPA
jgi:transposase, IS5 family